MHRIVVWIAVVGLLAVCVAGGAILADSLAGGGDEPTRSLPRFETAQPVLAPVDESTAPVASDDGGTGGGGSTTANVDGIVSVANPYDSPAPDIPAPPERPALPTLPEPREVAPPGFLDPCSSSESCAGVLATVLGRDTEPPFQILAVLPGVCELGADEQPEGGTPFHIISNRPAAFGVEVTYVRMAPGFRPDRPDAQGLGATPPSEVARWRAGPTFVSACVGVPVPNVAGRFDVVAAGFPHYPRDALGSDRYTTVLDTTGNGRPPVVIEVPSPSDAREDQIHVAGPAKSGRGTGVLARLLELTPCADAGPHRFRAARTEPVSPDLLGSSDYPYDPAYDRRFATTFTDLQPGIPYYLCLEWRELDTVVERVQYEIRSPHRWNTTFRVTGVDFPHGGRGSETFVSMLDGRCHIQLEGDDIVRRISYPGSGLGADGCTLAALEPVPGSRRPSIGPGHDDVYLPVLVHASLYGRESTNWLKVPIDPCLESSGCATTPVDRTYRPLVGVTTGLCGSGDPNGCDPPRTTYAVVHLLAHQTQVPRVSSGVGAWEVGPPTTY